MRNNDIFEAWGFPAVNYRCSINELIILSFLVEKTLGIEISNKHQYEHGKVEKFSCTQKCPRDTELFVDYCNIF